MCFGATARKPTFHCAQLSSIIEDVASLLSLQLDKQIVRRAGFCLQESTGLLVGDVLLSAACIAYYGAFPGNYRQELVSGWVDKCREYGIPVSPDCTLRGTLASPIQVHFTH